MAAGDQLGIAVGSQQNRRLFPRHFLADRLPQSQEFRSIEVEPAFTRLRELWLREREGLKSANEAQTEDRWIQPVLEALGFDRTVQVNIPLPDGRRQPDYALFLGEEDRRQADMREGLARYERAVAVADAKRYERPLDKARVDGVLSASPVAQIITYISITRRPWGILTNGRHWRLYAAAGDLVGGAHYELDLIEILEQGTEESFRYFVAFFSAARTRRGGVQRVGRPPRRSVDRVEPGEHLGHVLQVGALVEDVV